MHALNYSKKNWGSKNEIERILFRIEWKKSFLKIMFCVSLVSNVVFFFVFCSALFVFTFNFVNMTNQCVFCCRLFFLCIKCFDFWRNCVVKKLTQSSSSFSNFNDVIDQHLKCWYECCENLLSFEWKNKVILTTCSWSSSRFYDFCVDVFIII